MKYQIGVIGSADGNLVNELAPLARNIGREIASYDCILLTGAGRGLSYEAVLGAKELNGPTIGVSPASNLKEHMEVFKFPVEGFDSFIYTGFGLKGRNVIMVRRCDALIAISGRMGTLNEFTTAYDEGKIIGILQSTGGISGMIEDVIKVADKIGGNVIYNNDPKTLVKELFEKLPNLPIK